MDGAIVDKIIANFEGKPFDEKNGTEPGLITKQNVPKSRGVAGVEHRFIRPDGPKFSWPFRRILRATRTARINYKHGLSGNVY
jgi:hypothetical protein